MQETAISARPDIIDKRLIRSYAYIDGKWTNSENGASIVVTDPACGQEFGLVARLGLQEFMELKYVCRDRA